MFEFTPFWILASLLSPSVVALLLGLAGLRTWPKPALLLISSALVQGGILLGQHYFFHIADRLHKLFDIPLDVAFARTNEMFSFAGPVPLALLLWAVFCQRGPVPAKGPPINVPQ